jgi:hypothetical protein
MPDVRTARAPVWASTPGSSSPGCGAMTSARGLLEAPEGGLRDSDCSYQRGQPSIGLVESALVPHMEIGKLAHRLREASDSG